MQTPSNGEKETRLVRGGENQDQYISDPNIDRESGSTSGTIGNQSLRANRSNGTPREANAVRRKEVVGKIVSHLIDECRNQVVAKKNEIQSIEAKIEEFETVLKQIEESTEQPE